MYKVLIAEDELPLLRGIKGLIEKTNPMFHVVYCAKNGKEALEYLENHEVDILFTDINMPMIDGLALLKHVNTYFTHIIPVVISGYDDFSYAKEAMKFGVKHYLLKPIDFDEFTSLLTSLESLMKDVSYTAKKITLENLLFTDPHTFVPFEFSPHTYLLYLCAGSWKSSLYEESQFLFEYKQLMHTVNQSLQEKDNLWIYPGRNTHECIMVLELQHEQTIQNYLTSLISTNEIPIPLTISISDPILSSTHFFKTLKQLRQRLASQLIFGHSSVLNETRVLACCKLTRVQKVALLHTVQKEGYTGFKTLMKSWAYELSNLNLTQTNLNVILSDIMTVLEESLGIASPLSLDSTVANLVSSHWAYDSLMIEFCHLCESMYFQGVHLTKTHAQLMQEVDDYILKHLNTPLNNQTLSDQFGLVAPYLSKLFKDYKGISTTQYIQSLRIENAKILLLEYPDLLAKDIADSLGYTSALYFSKAFKKHVGVYPSEYRDQHLNS